MGLVNRRNAVLGWAVWTVGKRAAKVKARRAVSTETATSKKKGIAAAAAAIGGAVFFWRRRRSGDQPS